MVLKGIPDILLHYKRRVLNYYCIMAKIKAYEFNSFTCNLC